MKTSSKLGAVALTAALAMGTVAPAFAAGQEISGNVSTQNNSIEKFTQDAEGDQQGTTGTEVTGTTYTAQLKVTVPMKIGVALPSDGGAMITPSAWDGTAGYGIHNNSDETTVYVTKVNAKEEIVSGTVNGAATNFKLVADAMNGTDATNDLVDFTLGMPDAVSLTATGVATSSAIAAGEALPISVSGNVKWHGTTADEAFEGQAMKVTEIVYTVSTKNPVTSNAVQIDQTAWDACTNPNAIETLLNSMTSAGLTSDEVAAVKNAAQTSFNTDYDAANMRNAAKAYIEANLASKLKF